MAARPDSRAQELLEQGASLYEEGKLYEALSCWKQVLVLDPGNEIAAEYLRFIEDNFQIGVDDFIEHHAEVVSTPPPMAAETARVPPVPSPAPLVAPQGTPPPMVAPPIPPGPGDESIEELDWSELLDEGVSAPPTQAPPMPPVLPVEGDEDFFEEPPPGSLDPPPGEERGAWGVDNDGPSEPPAPLMEVSQDDAPMDDPLGMPTHHFAAEYKPPVSSKHGSVSEEIGPDVSRRRRRSSAEQAIADQRRDLALMSDDSIEIMLDEDFKAFDEHAEDSDGEGATAPDDSMDLEAMMAAGIDTPAPATARALAEPEETPEPALPPEVEAPDAVPEHAPAPSDLEALLQAGLADIDAIESGDGPPPRDLMHRPPPGTDLDALMDKARQKQQAGDFSGSLALVEDVLAGNPDHAEAREYLEENTTRLLAMYRSKLGKLRRAPRVKLRPQEIIWQSLDHRAGFILSQVDGLTAYEDIIEISGMTELEATRVLARLVEHGVIG